MANWTAFRGKFSGSATDVIDALEESYLIGWGITTYRGFVDRGTSQVATDMLQMTEDDPFLVGLATYLLDRAAANVSGNWVDYPTYFETVDLPWASVIVDYYDSGSFSSFAAMTVGELAEALADANTVPGVWDFYAPALWVRVNALGLDEFVASFEDGDEAAVAAFVDTLVGASFIEDFGDLLGLKKGQLAAQIATLSDSHALPVRLANAVKDAMNAVLADYPADDELADSFQGALTGEYNSAVGRGGLALAETLIDNTTIDTLAEIGGLSASTLANQIVALSPGHAFLQGVGDWLVEKIRAHHVVAAEPEPIATHALALRIYTENMEGDQSPVVGYVVEVVDQRYSYVQPVLAELVSNAVGMISFTYAVGDPEQDLEYEVVLTPYGGGSPITISGLSHDPAAGSTADVEATLPSPASPYKTIAQLEVALGSSFDTDLMTFLDGEGYETLEAIRLVGGLARIEDAAVQDNLSEAILIDQHAQLELISTDLVKNQFLIELGYTSLMRIGERARAGFVEEVSTAVGTPFNQTESLLVWNRARKVSSLLRSHVLAYAGDAASGAQARFGVDVSEAVVQSYQEVFGSQCKCPECSSGVSPVAYLASLLDYAQSYVEEDGTLVDADGLQVRFGHPYCELPADCSSVTEEVCQVRVAVEVLRQHLTGDASWALKRPYMEKAYRLLLTQAGTTLEELRVVATQSGAAEKELLAQRLGILPAQMEALHLDVILTYLTEHNLELLFGLQDTLRHPLSTGIKEGDTGNDVYSWRFEDVYWKRNTDTDGWIYLDINLTTVNVYRSSTFNGNTLVATGTLSSTAPWTVLLNPVDDYGLSGRIELVSNTVNVDTVKISVLPRLLAWRLEGLRRNWLAEDWADAGNYFGVGRLPYLDPDIVGVADLRGVGDVVTTDVIDQPNTYMIWGARRFWLDETLGTADMALDLATDDLQAAFDTLTNPVDYATWSAGVETITPWNFSNLPLGYSATDTETLFAELRFNLNDAALREGAVALIRDWMHLSMEAFVRLAALELRLHEVGGATYTDEEKADLLAILTQAIKMAFRQTWVDEEVAQEIDLTETIFWPSLLAPRSGAYNLKQSGALFGVVDGDVPFLDPDFHQVYDLVPPAYGDSIHSKRTSRIGELAAIQGLIYAARSVDYEEMFDEAYGGSTPSFPSPFTDMAGVYLALSTDGAPDHATALAYVNEDLKLTVEEFSEIMETVLRELANVSVSDAEYLRMAELLVRGHKRNYKWPNWAADEASDFLLYYWMVYRSGISDWVGGMAQRGAWEAALAQNIRVPMVDPDLVGPGDFFDPEYRFASALDNPAFALWWIRNNAMNGAAGWLDTIEGATLVDNLADEIGTTDTELEALHTLYEEGVDVSGRLRQLGLVPSTLAQLVNILGLVSPSTAERAVFDAIVLDVKRRRMYGKWNDEERTKQLTLGPDFFVEVYPHAAEKASYVSALLKPWRGRLAARRAWEDRLAARMDQEATLMAAHAGMLHAVEGDSLRTLRDILIMKDADPEETLADRAGMFSGLLLTDMDTACCQNTTRVAAAIETLQQLFHGLRTSQLVPALSDDFDLANTIEDFDSDWEWLGSYANWRGLMFVYLYPENLLLPSLRAHRTGTFAGLVDQLRNNPRLSPDMVCGVLKTYEGYLTDLHSLKLGASVTTKVYTRPDGCGSTLVTERVMHYQFATGGDSMQVYWSAYDESAGSGVAQSFWEPVPGLDKIHRIVGAFVYTVEVGERYLYVMGIKQPQGREEPQLIGNRYHLGTHRWQSDLEPFEGPVNNWTWVIGERTDETRSPVFGATTHPFDSDWTVGSKADLKLRLQSDLDLSNRSLKFNRLGAEGTTWEQDEFVEVQLNWVGSFRLDALLQPAGPGHDRNMLIVIGRTKLVDAPGYSIGYFSWIYGSSIKPNRVLPYNKAGLNDPIFLNDIFGMASSPERAAFIIYMNSNKAWNLLELSSSYSLNKYAGMLARQLPSSVNSYTSQYSFYYTTDIGATVEVLVEILLSPNPNSMLINPSSETLEPFSPTKIGPAFRHVGGLSPLPASVAFQSNVAGSSIHLNLVPVLGGPSQFQLLRLSPMPNTVFPLMSGGAPQSNRRNAIHQLFDDNALYSFGNSAGTTANPNLVYIEEAYYHLPMLLALELQKQRFYVEALDLYRLVFDYSQAVGQRKVFYGLIREENLGNLMQNVFAWLDDPENPHTVAAQRANSYTRFTLFSIVRCLLEYADQEYTRDTAESVPRAKVLYNTAANLLREEFFADGEGDCDAALAQLDVQVTDAGWLPVWIRLRERIAETNDHALIHRMLDGYAGGTPYDGLVVEFASGVLTWEEKITNAEGALQEQLAARVSVSDRLCTILNTYGSSAWNLPMIGGGVASTNRMALLLGERGDANLSEVLVGLHGGTDIETIDWLNGENATGILPQGRASGYASEGGYWANQYAGDPVAYLGQSGALKRSYVPYSNHYFCVPSNPVPDMLLYHAELNLYKIRHCMNIAGIKRNIEPYVAATDNVSGLPVIGAGGQIMFPGASSVPSTGYRYEVLLNKAKELTQYAQQLESALLSSLEKRDAEHYSLMKARQDVKVARASVRLQDLRIQEAENGVTLAELQRDRSNVQITSLQSMIDAGLNGWEQAQVDLTYLLSTMEITSANLQAMIDIARDNILGAGLAGVSGGASVGAVAAAMALRAPYLGEFALRSRTQANLAFAGIQASFERRKQEWQFQQVMANQDLLIGNQQITLAQDRLQVVGQERQISQMQMDHAEATVDFLLNKFTNAELYDWMSRVLEGVYSYFLQQATAMAKLAQQQLAFERQVAPPALVQDDYWYPSSENVNFEAGEGTRVDRKGLTGSTRLLQDITRLDLYGFETLKRKQQITRTISLSQLNPGEFAQFKETGTITFRTPMEIFDRDFPGHYLRLIRKVRTTVVALVPPIEGVKARLSTTGLARVVTGPMVFQNIRQTRGAESVALSGGYNDSGLFEMNPLNGELLNPFEGMGVDAIWEFRMDKASNPFDFDTVADVLLTIEYTALESEQYREEVLRQLGNTVSGEASFSLKYSFPDQWYDLHNADLTASPYRISLPLSKKAFPAHLKHVKVSHVSVLCVADEAVANPNPIQVSLTKTTGNTALGGVATTNALGMASTRQRPSQGGGSVLYAGNAVGWGALVGTDAAGDWILDFKGSTNQPLNSQVLLENLFKEEHLKDIVLIVTYQGEI